VAGAHYSPSPVRLGIQDLVAEGQDSASRPQRRVPFPFGPWDRVCRPVRQLVGILPCLFCVSAPCCCLYGLETRICVVCVFDLDHRMNGSGCGGRGNGVCGDEMRMHLRPRELVVRSWICCIRGLHSLLLGARGRPGGPWFLPYILPLLFFLVSVAQNAGCGVLLGWRDVLLENCVSEAEEDVGKMERIRKKTQRCCE
jgi:hypothetical protein